MILSVKVTKLEVGNVLALPMGRTATVLEIKPWSKRSRFLRFRTENGWHRVEIYGEMQIEVEEPLDMMDCPACKTEQEIRGVNSIPSMLGYGTDDSVCLACGHVVTYDPFTGKPSAR